MYKKIITRPYFFVSSEVLLVDTLTFSNSTIVRVGFYNDKYCIILLKKDNRNVLTRGSKKECLAKLREKACVN
jgi:hypothetical protein